MRLIEGVVAGHRIGASKHKVRRSCVHGHIAGEKNRWMLLSAEFVHAHIAGEKNRWMLLSAEFVHARKPLAIVTIVLCYAVAVASPGPL